MGLQLPIQLKARYEGARYIARMPFFINETVGTDENLMLEMQNKRIGKDDILFGIAGFRLLDIFANYGLNDGMFNDVVAFDQNHTQIKAMDWVIQFIKESPNPDKFIDKFIPFYLSLFKQVPRQGKRNQSEEDRNFFAVAGLGLMDKNEEELMAYFKKEIESGISWLSPKKYARVKQRVGTIHTAIIDFRDPERVSCFHQSLTDQKKRVGAFYLSTAVGFIIKAYDFFGKRNSPENKTNFINNYNQLLDRNSAVIYAIPTEEELKFQMILGDKQSFSDRLLSKLPSEDQITHKFFKVFAIGRLNLTVRDEGPNIFIMGIDEKYQAIPPLVPAMMEVANKVGGNVAMADTGSIIFTTTERSHNSPDFIDYLQKELTEALARRGVDEDTPMLRKKGRQ